jgi:hypothetical protein
MCVSDCVVIATNSITGSNDAAAAIARTRYVALRGSSERLVTGACDHVVCVTCRVRSRMRLCSVCHDSLVITQRTGSDDFTMMLWTPASAKKPIARMHGHQQLGEGVCACVCMYVCGAWHCSMITHLPFPPPPSQRRPLQSRRQRDRVGQFRQVDKTVAWRERQVRERRGGGGAG